MAEGWGGSASDDYVRQTGSHACNCVGPQNGQPRCPCLMAGLVQRDGRWIEPERDLGPVNTPGIGRVSIAPQGCICPPTSEQTCQSATCPRKRIGAAGALPDNPIVEKD